MCRGTQQLTFIGLVTAILLWLIAIELDKADVVIVSTAQDHLLWCTVGQKVGRFNASNFNFFRNSLLSTNANRLTNHSLTHSPKQRYL
jgi:hypothetical protein